MSDSWRRGLVPALVLAALTIVAGVFVSPARGETPGEHLLLVAGAGTVNFVVVLLLVRGRIRRPAPRQGFPVSRWLLVALAAALAALGVYLARQ